MTATNNEVETVRRRVKGEELAAVLAKSPIPERMHGGLIRYVVDHKRPGDFLLAILRNNLSRACAKADDENRYLIFEYVSFLWNWAPSRCWGDEEEVSDWMDD